MNPSSLKLRRTGKTIIVFTMLCIGTSVYQSNAMEPNITSEMLQNLTEQIKKGSTPEKAAPIMPAIQAAQKGMQSSSAQARDDALWLFTVLVKKGFAIEEATKAAQQGSVDENIYIQARSMDLFARLVSEGYAYDEATKAALYVIAAHPDEPMESETVLLGDTTIHTHAMRVLMQLAVKGQSIDAIIKVALLALEKNAGMAAMELFKVLTEKGYAIAEATTAAQKIVDDFEERDEGDFFVFAKASTLLDNLKKKKVKSKK
jgi:hypothetical protein